MKLSEITIRDPFISPDKQGQPNNSPHERSLFRELKEEGDSIKLAPQ